MSRDQTIYHGFLRILAVVDAFARSRGLRLLFASGERPELLCEWPDPAIRKLICIREAENGDLIVAAAADEERILGRVKDPNEQWFFEEVGRVELARASEQDTALTEEPSARPLTDDEEFCLLALLQQAWRRLDDFTSEDLAREFATSSRFVEQWIDPVLKQFSDAAGGELVAVSWGQRTITWQAGGTWCQLRLYLDPVEGIGVLGTYLRRRGLLRRWTWLLCPEVGPRLTPDWGDAEVTRQGLRETRELLERYASVADPWDRVRGTIPDQMWRRLRRLRTTAAAARWLALPLIVAAVVVGRVSERYTSATWPQLVHSSALPFAVAAYFGVRVVNGRVAASVRRLMSTLPAGTDQDMLEAALWSKEIPAAVSNDMTTALDSARYRREKVAGRPLWRTEMSRLHAIVWVLGLLAVVHESVPTVLPFELPLPVLLALVFIGLIKGAYWLLWVFATPATRTSLMRAYRWAGSLVGTLVLGVGIPAAVIGFFAVIILVSEALGARW